MRSKVNSDHIIVLVGLRSAAVLLCNTIPDSHWSCGFPDVHLWRRFVHTLIKRFYSTRLTPIRSGSHTSFTHHSQVCRQMNKWTTPWTGWMSCSGDVCLQSRKWPPAVSQWQTDLTTWQVKFRVSYRVKNMLCRWIFPQYVVKNTSTVLFWAMLAGRLWM